jgi:hypothetical protein
MEGKSSYAGRRAGGPLRCCQLRKRTLAQCADFKRDTFDDIGRGRLQKIGKWQ